MSDALTSTMIVKQIYESDLGIAKSLIDRDEAVTRSYFYRQCYPLFKAIYSNYHTDCGSCKEFMDEIYLLLLSPSKTTGKCQLENYRGESTLATWIKSACLFYCYKKYEIKRKMPTIEEIYTPYDDEDDNGGDRKEMIYGSVSIDIDGIDQDDILKMLKQMPNKRYSSLLEMRYLMEMTNEETAAALELNMDCYYNVHKRAKVQFMHIYKKENRYE